MRDSVLASLGEEVFDLLVIGGGITGAGVARDAAGRGLRVALVDKGDIGAGTSSLSSRLVHGGLRYLETYDFDLVFEALRERRRLLELAPHLVRPLRFLYPVFADGGIGPLKLRAGMWLYDALSTFRSPGRHRMLKTDAVAEREPMLKTAGLRAGALYYDAQVDDARLTLAVAQAAHETGAVILTHAGVESISGGGERSPTTIKVADQLTPGRTLSIQAKVVLNATGPWCDRIRQLADPDVEPRLRTTKGVHIVVDQRRIGNRGALILRSSVDGRVMFVLPWGALTYIGTTDTELAGDPGSARADGADVRYLLESANSLFPEAHLRPEDVVSTWAGVRPLLAPAPSEHLSESETSREHAIWRDPSGLVNIAGGKLTTYRSMAAEAADFLANVLEKEFGIASGDFHTDLIPLPGAPEDEWEMASERLQREAAAVGIAASTGRALTERYGEQLTGVLALIREDPTLGEELLSGRPYLRAEVVHAVREELALTLEDVMRRRLHLFYEEVDGGIPVAELIAGMMASEEALAWSPEEVARQIGAYEAAVAETRPTSTMAR